MGHWVSYGLLYTLNNYNNMISSFLFLLDADIWHLDVILQHFDSIIVSFFFLAFPPSRCLWIFFALILMPFIT